AKTGTAEHGPNPQAVAPHVWYVAFAPADDPQVAVAALVESGGDRSNLAATGGTVAAPIGRAVIRPALGRDRRRPSPRVRRSTTARSSSAAAAAAPWASRGRPPTPRW